MTPQRGVRNWLRLSTPVGGKKRRDGTEGEGESEEIVPPTSIFPAKDATPLSQLRP